MKLAILSTAPHCYSTKRLRAAAGERGHTVKVLNTLKFSMTIEKESPELFFRNRRLSPYDAVVPRIGASITNYGVTVVRQFQQMGVFCANSANSISNTRDKLRCLQILSRYDVGIAPTAFVRDRKDILPAIERVGGAPVIIKLTEGTQGKGVILAETQKVAEAIVESFQGARQNVLIQKFVKESVGRDVRAFVVGDRVVASMRRVAQGQEFRSNLHRGGHAEPIQLDATYERTAIKAAQILGLRVAGVDMLEAEDGPQVIEVNSSPGLEGIETCTGVDVAGAIIEYVEDQVLFPELDIREKMSVHKGYGVAELLVPRESDLAGKCIDHSGLRELDIVILSLERFGHVELNPPGCMTMEGGDRLLAFGRLSSMKALVPARTGSRKKRRPAITRG